MSDPFHQLLEATIDHLQILKARGTRFVAVSPETLSALSSQTSPPATRSRVPHTMEAPAAATLSSRQSAGGRHLDSAAAVGQSSRLPERKASGTLAGTVAGEAACATPHAAPAALPLEPATRAQAMAALRERAMVCLKCPHLAASRKTVVFGVGDICAPLLFIGEAPGADEDEQGEPFVGKAGQLLTRIIQTMGFTRETVYIANILKCRPDTPGQNAGNRKPTSEEMQTCIPYLHEQIDLIQPRVIVALGGTAVEGLLGKTVGITRLRGQWQLYRNIPLMPTFHPSYLLRNQALGEKRKVWEDMLQVMEKLGLPISEKQRGFFLRG